MRKFFALLSTSAPARANAGSTSPATAASSAENTIGALTLVGIARQHGRVARRVGGSVALEPARGFARTVLPAERSDAASSASSNHGWSRETGE